MVDETRYIPVKVLRQGNIYYLNCEAFDIVEKSSNLLHCIEQMKTGLSKSGRSAPCWRKITSI
ncbi:hypothetical protein BANRA_03946 [Acinetobacter baumannii]|nr:hypothetical protein BANRA_03946 [Acinetobacter baumannii]